MHTQELLVEQGSEGQAVKGLHTGIVHPFRIFYFTCSRHMVTKHRNGIFTSCFCLSGRHQLKLSQKKSSEKSSSAPLLTARRATLCPHSVQRHLHNTEGQFRSGEADLIQCRRTRTHRQGITAGVVNGVTRVAFKRVRQVSRFKHL